MTHSLNQGIGLKVPNFADQFCGINFVLVAQELKVWYTGKNRTRNGVDITVNWLLKDEVAVARK